MLKYILIGIGILLVVGFIGVILWKSLLSKLADYKRNKGSFSILPDSGAAEKISEINRRAKNTLLRGLAISVVLVGIVIVYIFFAKSAFLKNHQHKYTTTIVKEATCIAEGTKHLQCEYCAAEHEEKTPIIEHDFIEKSRVEATCVRRGQIVYECSMCSKSKNEVIPFLEHEFKETDKKAPTCQTKGAQISTCKLCGRIQTKEIAVIDHTYTEVSRVEASCTYTGKAVYTCSVCNEEYSEVLPKNDVHSYKTYSYIPSEFFSPGRNNNICEYCGEQYYSLRLYGCEGFCIFALIFLFVSLPLFFSVLNDESRRDGVRRYVRFWVALFLFIIAVSVLLFHFTVVDADLKGERWYDKLFVSENSSECNFVKTSESAASCTENGSVVYSCTVCSDSYTEQLPLKPHSYQQTDYSAPSCTRRGKTTYMCTACEKTYADYTDKLSHTYTEQTIEPTCTLHGIRTYTCSGCRHSYKEEIEPTGHQWGDWVDAAAANGRQIRSCSVCGEVDTK